MIIKLHSSQGKSTEELLTRVKTEGEKAEVTSRTSKAGLF